MLVTLNNNNSNHVVNDFVVSLIIYIYPWGITTSILHGYAEVINNNVDNTYLVYQVVVLI